MEKRIRCYTIGYSNRKMEDFVEMLQKKEINHLVDIRRYPQSWRDEFDKEQLKESLPKHGISYSHCGGVGGMREGSYTDHMRTGEFKRSFSRLVERIVEVNELGGNIVLMCAEKNPKDCHRYYLSLELEKKGIEMTHLTESGQTSLFMYE